MLSKGFDEWFLGWLTTFLIVAILNLIAWIYSINLRGSLGWLSFLTWLFSLILALKFTFSWYEEESLEMLVGIFIVFSLITFTTAFVFRSIEPKPFMKTLLISTSVSCFLLLSIFLLFIERNATLYMVYMMKTEDRFLYPSAPTFKKEVDWESFFKAHNDRKWLREALTYYFTDQFGDEFRKSLFNEWSNFNSSHPDKIDFSATGIMKYDETPYFIIRSTSQSDLLTWWIKETKIDSRQRENLKAFLEQLILILNQDKDRSITNRFKLESDKLNTLQEVLVTNRAAVKELNDKELYEIYLKLAILNQSLVPK